MPNQTDAPLYVVATPIGNLDDMTFRAIETLKSVDIIYAEDTRQTHKLLQHFGLKKTVYQLHKHNEQQQKHDLHRQLVAGHSVAIVSDAGTPLIADPGYITLAYLREHHHDIRVIPGCSSVIAALSISGLPSDNFRFIGFTPSKPTQRQTFLTQLQDAPETTVFFETPHRIVDCLRDCLALFGEARQIFIGRELTKQFEESILCTISEAQQWISENPNRVKGEFVLALAPAEKVIKNDWQALASLLLTEGVSTKTASKIISSYYGESKKVVYNYLLSLSTTQGDKP